MDNSTYIENGNAKIEKWLELLKNDHLSKQEKKQIQNKISA